MPKSTWAATVLVAALILGFLSFHGATRTRSVSSASPSPIVIQVQGDIPRPGLHLLPGPKATVGDALRAAGGIPDSGSEPVPKEFLTTFASPGTVLRVSRGVDGIKLTTEPMPTMTRLLIGIKLDLNEASEEDLMCVPRMKRETAHAIVERRKEKQWHDIDELTGLPGVGAKTVERWRSALSVN